MARIGQLCILYCPGCMPSPRSCLPVCQQTRCVHPPPPVQALADKKKGITDEDLLALVGDEVHQAAVVWELVDLQVKGGGIQGTGDSWGHCDMLLDLAVVGCRFCSGGIAPVLSGRQPLS